MPLYEIENVEATDMDPREVIAAIFGVGRPRTSERELALDYILCYVVDALHDGRIVITREDMDAWRQAAIDRGQWGNIYDATLEADELLTLRVNWQPLPTDDDDA